jgi:hypothetical protein
MQQNKKSPGEEIPTSSLNLFIYRDDTEKNSDIVIEESNLF